jgi:hypothetical protein
LIVPDVIVVGMAFFFGGMSAFTAYLVLFTRPASLELPLLAVLAGLSALVTILFLVLRFALARQIWNMTGDNPIRRWIGENAIRTDTPTATATEAWSRYDRYAKCQQMLVLRERSGRHVVLPRSHCSSNSDWQALIELVDRKVPIGPWGLIWR